jgi:peptidoglycan hydrolase-like protein with peptidoglycan-binding domain
MPKLLSTRSTVRLALAALAAGGLTLPAVAQDAAKKSAPAGTAHHATTHSSSLKSTHTSTNTSGGKSTATQSSTATTSSGKKSTSHKGAKGVSSKKSRRAKGQAAPTPERVNEIQDALGKNGAYSGPPTGKWDDSTVDAMKKFQSAHGLNPTGKMDALTLQKLGLGSETAGAGAPTPPPNTANRLLSSSNHRD